jgi:hypothetical protein
LVIYKNYTEMHDQQNIKKSIFHVFMFVPDAESGAKFRNYIF